MPFRRSPIRLRRTVLAAVVTALVAAGPAVTEAQRSPEAAAEAERPGNGGPEKSIPEGLHELVPWEDLRALRTFFERVDPVEERRLPEAGPWPDSLEDLAAELGDHWRAPYEFVRDRVAYLPYPGAVRGAQGALRSGIGNSLDQALLLRELLRRRGERAELVRGRLPWRDAEELVDRAGTGVEDREIRLLWAGFAADHWWVETVRDGRVVPLDPSFVGGEPGSTPGREGARVDEVPPELIARLRLEARLGTRELGSIELPTADIVGRTLRVGLVPVISPSSSDPVGDETESVPSADGPSREASRGRRAGVGEADHRPEGGVAGPMSDPLESGSGPWRVRIRWAGQSSESDPVEEVELAGLALRLRIQYPEMPTRRLDLPWGRRASAEFAVAFAGGDVGRRRVVASAVGLHRLLDRLAEAEERAWQDMRPPIAYARAARSLRETALEAWQRFVDLGPESLAWIALATADRFDGPGKGAVLVRSALRLAVVRWDAPTTELAGRLSVLLDQPAFVARGGDAAGVRAVQVARGVLESAMVSELLHRITGNASTTAFDVTLRAAGAGPSLARWERSGSEAEAWPATARAQIREALGLGFRIVAPVRPVDGEVSSVGWWTIAPGVGRTRGWVSTPDGPFQGVAELDGPWQSRDLDLLLLGVRSLHRALPALVGLAGRDGDPGGGDDVVLAVCPAAALVAEILAPKLPQGWAPPELGALCPSPASRRGAGSRDR